MLIKQEVMTRSNQPQHVRHYYLLSKSVNTYNVYELIPMGKVATTLSEIIRIEKYRGYSGATKITEYLRERTTNNWKTSKKVTGLRPTKVKGVFYGDTVYPNGKKDLIIFKFTEDRQGLIIDVYRSYYPYVPSQIHKIVQRYRGVINAPSLVQESKVLQTALFNDEPFSDD